VHVCMCVCARNAVEAQELLRTVFQIACDHTSECAVRRSSVCVCAQCCGSTGAAARCFNLHVTTSEYAVLKVEFVCMCAMLWRLKSCCARCFKLRVTTNEYAVLKVEFVCMRAML
jgi:hypothetical protein